MQDFETLFDFQDRLLFSAPTIMPRELKLNCLVLDDNNDNNAFSVRITDEDTNVDDLKHKIKEDKQVEQVAFRDISADTLELWNVSVPGNEVLKTNRLRDLRLKQGPLRGVKKLVNLFPDTPRNDHLHIIVQLPHIAGASRNLFVSFDISCVL